MPSINVKNQDGAEVGSVELAANVFEAPLNAVLVREVYNAYMANQRQGTHMTKTRALVSGGGKKPWKQKHTGRARQGSIRAPQWRHGAIIFGPVPRDYREKVNAKKRKGAIRAMLSSKREAGALIVVDSIDFGATPKTKNAVEFLAKVGAKGKTLILTAAKNESLLKAAGNLAGSTQNPTRVQIAQSASVFDLLTCDTLLIEKAALAFFEEHSA
jgi:large subunit ribosomal protein L4